MRAPLRAAGTRPCAFCRRPVPQPYGDRRPVRFCQDNEGGCERAADRRRSRDRDTAGLPGRVAEIWDLADRLEDVAVRLAESLRGELSAAGVDRRTADIEAVAAAEVAAAAREREAARAEVEEALTSVAYHRLRADAAERRLAALRDQSDEDRDTVIRDLRTLVAKMAAERSTP